MSLLVLLLELKYFAQFAIAYTSLALLEVFCFDMANFTAKKAKVMDCCARIRHNIQLEVAAESEGCFQHIKSVLHINSWTSTVNLLIWRNYYRLFSSLRRGMTSQTPFLLHQVRFHATTHQTLAMLRFKQISFQLISSLVGKILLAVLTFTHPVNQWKTT